MLLRTMTVTSPGGLASMTGTVVVVVVEVVVPQVAVDARADRRQGRAEGPQAPRVAGRVG